MKCSVCGTDVDLNAKFCSVCGIKLERSGTKSQKEEENTEKTVNNDDGKDIKEAKKIFDQ